LIAGAGGGFDIFSGLPLYFGLRAAGKQVHLANLSFSHLEAATGRQLSPATLEVTADSQVRTGYFPEYHLCRWFRSQGEEVPVYCFDRTGFLPLLEGYKAVVAHLQPDTVILVDGGTDSLMRGDEAGLGTPEEDIASIAAVDELDVARKYLVCLGLPPVELRAEVRLLDEPGHRPPDAEQVGLRPHRPVSGLVVAEARQPAEQAVSGRAVVGVRTVDTGPHVGAGRQLALHLQHLVLEPAGSPARREGPATDPQCERQMLPIQAAVGGRVAEFEADRQHALFRDTGTGDGDRDVGLDHAGAAAPLLEGEGCEAGGVRLARWFEAEGHFVDRGWTEKKLREAIFQDDGFPMTPDW
jgi:hypothetical protein